MTKPRPGAAPRRTLTPSPELETYLASLHRMGRRPATLAGARKILAAAEHDHGRPLADVDADAWAQWAARQHAANLTRVAMLARFQTVRRYLAWARAPIPDVLNPGRRVDALPPAWRTALTDYLAHEKAAGHPTTTRETRRRALERFAASGHHPDPFAVTAGDLVDWVGGAEHWAPETRYSARCTLRSFYGWARDTDRMDHNPAQTLPRVRRPFHQAVPLPEEHLARALAGADERLALMLTLAAGHGLRRGEISRVHSRDVLPARQDPSRWILNVRGKGGKDRHVPIGDDLARVIRDAAGWLFPGHTDGHLSPGYVGKLVGRALPPGWGAHAGRHLFATTGYRTTRDLLSLQALLGHASPETTRRYVTLDERAARDVVDVVQRAMPSLGTALRHADTTVRIR